MTGFHVIPAVFWRNFSAYLSSLTGYIFIIAFILVSCIYTFVYGPFFSNNLANLDTLNQWYPVLLLLFIPSITMSTWADERRQGTDELLLTLPATDFELALGKYLACVGIYSTALLVFCLTNLGVLAYLGSPDSGVILGTYFAYWLLGAGLISIGMCASLLTGSTTVAFILGALLAAVPTIGVDFLSDWIPSFGAINPLAMFRDVASGVLSVHTLTYFLGLIALMLYLGMVLLARRHMAGGVDSVLAWTHLGLRSASSFAIVVCLTILAARFGTRIDLTQERLHSLSPQTREILDRISADRPVFIQAYISPEVPQEYVQTRKSLLNLLKEYDAIGGDRIHLKISETLPYTAEAREADERFGVKPREIRSESQGKAGSQDVFLGIAVTCGPEENVLPFMFKGLPVEYELTLAVGVVSGSIYTERRKKVGIVSTDAKLFGGFDFETMNSSPPWSIIEELKKQYDVAQVSLDSPSEETFHILVAPMPSSLTQPQLDELARLVRKGIPTLILDDPLPSFNLGLSPSEPKRGRGGRGGMFGGQPPGNEQKGNIGAFLENLGVSWRSDIVAWASYNPHPNLGEFPEEFLFIGPGSGNPKALNPDDPASAGLQEIVMLFGGSLTHNTRVPVAFTPLLRTDAKSSGTLGAGTVFQRSFMGYGGLNPDRPHYIGDQEIVAAARVRGTLPAEKPADAPKDAPPPKGSDIHVIMVADADLVSEVFFNLRRDQWQSLNFDNVPFILNCVDTLAGVENFVPLRRRRVKHRTLEKVELLTKDFEKQRVEQTKAAEKQAEDRRTDAQNRLNEKVRQLRERQDLDDMTRQIMLQNLEEVENRRLEVTRKNIDDEKKAAIAAAKATEQVEIQAIQWKIRFHAVFWPVVITLVFASAFLILLRVVR